MSENEGKAWLSVFLSLSCWTGQYQSTVLQISYIEPTITCYLSRHMKTHVSLQQENVLIRILFAVAGSTQSKKQKQTKKPSYLKVKAAA